MNPQEEPTAGRLAAVLLILGLVILVVSLGVLSFGERSQSAAAGANSDRLAKLDPDAAQLTWVRAMFWLALLIFFFVLALTAFLRWSRHYRHRLLHKSSPPTDYSDAWSQYRLPPDYDDLDDDDEDDEDEDDFDENDREGFDEVDDSDDDR